MQAPDEKTLARYGWSDKREARIPGRILRSKAYIDLSHTAIFILSLFFQRRTWYKDGKGKNTKRIYKDRGLLFTYNEAQHLWGITPRVFRDCIVQLIEHGFLKVEEHGGTLQGNRVPTKYMLVSDWQHYGTYLFVKPEIPASICYNDNLKRINETRLSKFSTEPHLSRTGKIG